MLTSLVIPCVSWHFKNLHPLLNNYLNGTLLPDETIISISNCEDLPQSVVEQLSDNYHDKLPNFKIIKNKGRLWHGPNRQVGTDASNNDLIIYQDADDIPHPQRIEIIKWFFENHDIVHLNHFWIPDTIEFSHDIFNPAKIPYSKQEEIFKCYFPNGKITDAAGQGGYGGFSGPVHGGPTSVLRSVFDKVKWKDHKDKVLSTFETAGEDFEFCIEVAYYLRKSIIIHADLNKYCGEPGQELYKRNPNSWEKLKYY